MSRYVALSGYRILWVMALFDLPVLTPQQRKKANRFRHDLLNEGFTMMQLSCYIRFVAGKDQFEALAGRIGAITPAEGKVDLITFTDKQYGNVRSFRGAGTTHRPAKPEQLAFF